MNETLKRKLWTMYRNLGERATTMNHWDLAAEFEDEVSAETWKIFLGEQDVIDWINSELNIVKNTEMSKVIKDISKSHNVGQAQLISALSKTDVMNQKTDGPIFIYTYVPLDSNQAKAKNVKIAPEDIFLRPEK